MSLSEIEENTPFQRLRHPSTTSAPRSRQRQTSDQRVNTGVQLDELFAETPEARVLFTTRNTFWATARADDRLRFDEYRVEPFDEDRREQFLAEWFDGDNDAKDRTKCLLGRIESLGNKSKKSPGDGISFSDSPYMLHLACLAAEEQISFGYDDDTWAEVRDPLDANLRSLSRREVDKNKIPTGKQNHILYTTALRNGETFEHSEFSFVVSLYEDDDERLEGMLSHHVIARRADRFTFLFNGFGDYLRAKAFASWLYDGEDQVFGVEENLEQINSENDTSVDIFGEISGFYGDTGKICSAFEQNHVSELFNGRTAQGLILLFSRALRQQGTTLHQEISDLRPVFSSSLR